MSRPGRKPSGMTRLNVMLDAGTVKAAKVLGFGNLSAGLREAVRRATAPRSKATK